MGVTEETMVAKGIKFSAAKEGYEISPLVPTPVGYDEEALEALLRSSGVDVSEKTEELLKLSDELLIGDSSLMKQPDGKIMRVVEVVILKMMRKNGDVLVQAWQETP